MSNINFGNWQDLDKLRSQNQWVDPHANAFGGLLRTLDPMTYAPGLNTVADAAHNIGDNFVNGANQALSPIVAGADKVTTTITPGLSQAREAVPMLGNVQNFANNKPFDTAALMAATFFSGGAASEAMGAGEAAVPAASGEAGAMGGMTSSTTTGTSLMTPTTFGSGAVSAGSGAGAAGSTTGSLIDAGAITPAMSSGSYGGAAGASGTGTFGTAGTGAATNMLTPAFESMGASSPGLLGQMQDGYKQFDKYDQYRRNLSKFSTPDNTKNDSYNASMALADQVLNSNDPRQERIKRIADKISMNRWGMRQ